MNVNESLCVDVNCNLSNTITNELGIDVNIKNLNQVHHPLMTEIMLNELTLFCSKYQLSKDRINCEYYNNKKMYKIINNFHSRFTKSRL